ncbi:hypothetical protein SS05631_c23250 [Sinorhizobium sp. CCBAU 05631]|nr:hypothetical protein SS05631_c23250 [Sinorhizobium sp. CCBAU 05631]
MPEAAGAKGLSAAFAGPHAWCNEKMRFAAVPFDGAYWISLKK